MGKLTIGYRCRIKEGSSWANSFEAGREVILKERQAREFSVIVLKKGTNIPLIQEGGTVVNEAAWFSEEKDLELVDSNIEANIRFMDWYEEVQEYECPDCLHLCWNEDKQESTLIDDENGEGCCPKCGCCFM